MRSHACASSFDSESGCRVYCNFGAGKGMRPQDKAAISARVASENHRRNIVVREGIPKTC